MPFLCLLAFSVALVLVLPPALFEQTAVNPVLRLKAAGTSLLTYGRLLVLPSGLHMDRLTPLAAGPGPILLGAVYPVCAAFSLFLFLRRPGKIRFGLLALASAYFGASGLVAVYPAIAGDWVFTPEQFMYLPLAAAGALAAGLLTVSRRPTAVGARRPSFLRGLILAAAGLLLALLGAEQIGLRQRQFAGEESLYRSTLAASPSPRACFNLGVVLMQGERWKEAVTVYEYCAGLAPADAGILGQLAVARHKAGLHAQARLAYAAALAMNPADALSWSNFAGLEAAMGDYSSAREKWQKALSLAPELAAARRGLAKLEEMFPP